MQVSEAGTRRAGRSPLVGTRPDSAKALLLVMLGEFAWPRGVPIWSALPLRALAELDIEENAARKALARTAESGFIVARREGRRVRWAVTDRGHQLLSAGFERTFGWPDRDMTWDGRWLLLSVTVPESQRNLRHHLQSRLAWAGLGSPISGQWLSPHPERAPEVASIVDDLGLADQAHSLIGRLGPLGDEDRLVHSAWDLDQLAAEYREFIALHAEGAEATERDCFRARVELVQAWRRFPYVDPDLPRRFLPADWPGFEASTAFQARHQALAAPAMRHWAHLERETSA